MKRILNGLFIIALMLIPVLTVHRHSVIIWTAEDYENVGRVFKSLLFIPADIAVAVVMVILLLANVWQHRAFIRRLLIDYGGIWWIMLAAWGGISALWATEPVLALYSSFHLLLEVLVAGSVAYVVFHQRERPLLIAAVLGMSFQALIAATQLTTEGAIGLGWLGEADRNPDNPFGFETQGFRGYGLEAHPNILAGALLIGLFLAFLLWLQNRRWWWGALAAIISVGLIATVSRNAIVVTLFTLLPLIIWLNRKRLNRAMVLRFSLVSLVIIGIAAVTIGRGFVGDFWDRTKIYAEEPEAFFDRLVFAKDDTIAVTRDVPLHGVGIGNLVIEIGLWRDPPDSPLLIPVHNVYLMVLAELGLIGFVFYGMGCLAILAKFRQQPVVVTLFLAICLSMLFDFYFWHHFRMRLLFFWVVGLCWGYLLRATDPDKPSPDPGYLVL